ncbi:MAG: hypothetical protein JWR01_2383 [Subtercola sp.]|nr:hypothetical protein [Subtercola sp.]
MNRVAAAADALKLDHCDSLRERKKLQTRAALQHAALELAAERGVQATSIDDICERAGVSSRTFFNYFPSKVSAIVGVSDYSVSAQTRATYLRASGDRLGTHDPHLLRDTCRLIADVVEQRSLDRADRELQRELVVETPELLRVGLMALLRGSEDVAALVSERLAGDRMPGPDDLESARLLTALVISALSFVVRDPARAVAVEDLAAETFGAARRMQTLGAA